MSLPYKQCLIPRAKELRKAATKEENHLWYDFLRNYPIRFQRQKTIGGFIVDFYCHKAALIVELDGSQHFTEQGKAYDMERSAILERYHLKVLRFSNYEINTNFSAVCEKIHQIVEEQIALKASLFEGGGTKCRRE